MFETNLTSERAQQHTADGYWSGKTINDYLDEVVARTPEKTAYIDSRRSVTFGELAALRDRCALGLLELGVRPGDVVSYQLPNWIEYVVLCLGASRIGAVNNPLIPIYREREVGFMVELAESKVIVVPEDFRGFDYPAMVDGLRSRWPPLEHVLVVGSEPGAGSFGEFLDTPWEQRRDPGELDALQTDPNDVTLLIFTSGTTGEPKGVMHTHNTLGAAVAPYGERFGSTGDDVVHMASTLAHLTGFLLPSECRCSTA